MKIKEVLDDLITLIRTEVADFNTMDADQAAMRVREYSNEYNPDVDWTPVFPSCFVELTNYTPEIFNNSMELIKGQFLFTLYVSNIYYDRRHVLQTLERIIDAVTLGTSTTSEGVTFRFKPGILKLLGKTSEIKIYTIQIIAL